ncbi:hypothetical protein G4B11_006263 [Aspergillus flavus]|nr:hypothetical protein G4B11_006263 [Aspergillus flavus]
MSTPLSYFQSASWCAAWLNHPDLRIDTSASNPFRETTKHDDAWKKRIFLYRASQDPQGIKSEGYIVMQIGAGVSGKDGVAHGGFLATLMDELTGGLVAALGLDRGLGIRTASLNTTYHKLLLAQGFIMARAEIVKVERRKVLVRFQMHNTPFTSILTADAVLLVEEDILAAMKPGLFVVIVGSHDYNVNNRNLFHRNGTFAIQLSPEQGDETLSVNLSLRDREVVSPPAESMITPEIVHLLRVYEKSIATWMDVFDSELTYQRRLLCMAPPSPLILNAICALAARQLSLVGSSLTWKPVSEHYYGQAVHLMARLLDAYPSEMELAIVGTILLSSYELLAFPGLDYQRHLRGAHTIVASLHAHNSASCLTRASFWIYARHEVADALNRNSPTLHDPGSWPKFDLSRAEPAEDSFCNDVVRLTAETVCIVFGKTSRSRTKRRKRDLSTLQGELRNWLHICPEQWKGTEYTEDGNPYTSPNHNLTAEDLKGAAIVLYHLSMLLLWHELEKVSEGPEGVNEMLDQVDAHSRQIILIALSSLPDSAIVVVVQPLCYAVKHIKDNTLKENAIFLLHDIEARTGFHTKSKLER